MYQDFDLLTFYRVTEDELNEKLLLFRSGRYKFEWEDIEFDMAEHNRFLAETADEVKEIRAKQREVQKEMIQAEKDSLAKWREEREKNKVDENTIEDLLAGMFKASLHCTELTFTQHRSEDIVYRSSSQCKRLENPG